MEFDVHITESLMRRVSLRRLFRRWPLTLLATTLIVAAAIFNLRRGHLGAITIIGLTALGMQFIIYISYYTRQRRSIADWKQMQGDAPVHYWMDEERLRATSNLGASELKWTVFRELLEHPDFLLLGMGRTGHLTLPRADIPKEAEQFIRQRFASLQLPTKKA